MSARVSEANAGRENEYDLLTAALIGLTIGAGLTFMFRRGPSGRRPVSPVVEGVGRGAAWAGRGAAWAGRGAVKAGAAGARWSRKRGAAAWDRIPREEIRDHVSDYAGRARGAMDDVVESELKDLRRAIRRQRKRLGI